MTRSSHRTTAAAISNTAAKVSDAAEEFGAEAQKVAAPWIERYARVGYAAKGFLYMLIGLLALQAAIGWGGQVADSRSALTTLQSRWWFGTALLWLVGFGLAGYSLWNLFRAALDPEDEGNGAKGITTRFFFAISGLVHAALALWIFTHLISGASGGDATEDRVGRLLAWGLAGRLLIAGIALGIAGYGIHQIIKGWREEIDDQLELSGMSPAVRRAIIWIARLGLSARGATLLIIAWFLLQAAWYSARGRAGGLGDALHSVGGFGPLVLGSVAAGLTAYGLFNFIKARYRRIDAQ